MMREDRQAVWEERQGDYLITSDGSKLDIDAIHAYLQGSYWAAGISREAIARSAEHSLCFGLLHKERQIGFARVVSEHTRFAYLMDVYVLEEYQGQGLGQWLVECVLNHPDLRNLRRVLLTTRDAHEFYRRLGFSELQEPQNWMELRRPHNDP